MCAERLERQRGERLQTNQKTDYTVLLFRVDTFVTFGFVSQDHLFSSDP